MPRLKRFVSIASFAAPYALAWLSRSSGFTTTARTADAELHTNEVGKVSVSADQHSTSGRVAVDQPIRLEEYKQLRKEMFDNRRFVFERPIVLATGIFAAAAVASKDNWLAILTLPFTAILFFNLWFTLNRLQSNARILSYMHLVHETKELPWIGWETALRLYRSFKAQKEHTPVAQQDHLRYFSPILRFHVGIAWLMAIALLGQEFWRGGIDRTYGIISYKNYVVLNIMGVAAYTVLSAFRFHPKNIIGSIEKERQLWIETFSLSRVEIEVITKRIESA